MMENEIAIVISTRYLSEMKTELRIRALMNRLARLDSVSSWSGDLNPAQMSALEYLRDANRFSRAPSHVAEFMGTTRGTMSQTLKALLRKGYVEEIRSASDKRSISYTLTPLGSDELNRGGVVASALGKQSEAENEALERALHQTLSQALRLNGSRSFGQCKTCLFHQKGNNSAYCQLLSLPLSSEDSEKICIEHQETLIT